MTDPRPPLEMLGDDDAPACADGVCAVPDGTTEPEGPADR